MKKFYLGTLMLFGACSSSSTTESTPATGPDALAKPDTGILFSKSDFGQNWPFKRIASGRVKCIDGNVVLFAEGYGIYALNGIARSVASERGWLKLDNEQIVGKSISPLLDAGKTLCE